MRARCKVFPYILSPHTCIGSSINNIPYQSNIYVTPDELTLSTIITQESESHSVMSDSLQFYGLYSPWNSPSQNTGMGSLRGHKKVLILKSEEIMNIE